MSNYAIGDVQGCYDPLMHLLEQVQFNDKQDTLWFTGDLVNRGTQSLEVLRFIKNLSKPAQISLGNHDLHFLACLFVNKAWSKPEDNIDTLLQAKDAEELGHWLRQQPLLCYSKDLSLVMTHAGIAPFWNLEQARHYAKEVENVLTGAHYADFLKAMYGNHPNQWSDNLTGLDRHRLIINCFTRMRFCDAEGRLDFHHKATIDLAPDNLYPWFLLPQRKALSVDIVFGHWAALGGICPLPELYAIDTGCVWGGGLTALRLEDKKRFIVPGV